MKNKIDTSRQKTPWDNKENKTCMQSFISDVYKENYQKKHPPLKNTKESEIINSLEIKKCKLCQSENIKKRGKTRSGIQIYYCNDCKHKFTPITNTIFYNHKISITEWIEFLLDIMNYSSITLTSKVNKNAVNTTNYWLHKIFLLIENWQDKIILNGDIYIDELYYKVLKSDVKKVNGKEPRGLSKNQMCIGIGYDGNNIVAIFEKLGKTGDAATKKAFIKHIEPNSHLIHDDEKSHHILVTKLNLTEDVYSSEYTKTLDDKNNPLQPINDQCDLIRKFLNAHSGFDREDIQGYLNLYCFISRPNKTKLELVEELLNIALTTDISIKYRDLFSKNK